MSRRTWRDRMMPLVAEVIESGKAAGLSGGELARYCCRSYPWGDQVGYWGRKVWLSEVKRQLGRRRLRARAGGEHLPLFDGGPDS